MNRQSLFAARLVALVIAGAGLAAAGCAGPLGDFHPLYATAAGPGLSRVETLAPDGRTGYLLRESLDDALALDRSKPPLYQLNLIIKERRTPRGLRIDNVANRYELALSTQYTLVDRASRTVLTSGTLSSMVTYDSADQAYAAVAAHEDGQKRIAADTAQRLRTALAAYFADPKRLAAAGAPVDGPDAQSLTDRMQGQALASPGAKAASQPGRDPLSDRPAP